MKHTLRNCMVVCCFALSACSTPDMTAFGNQTAALQVSVADENQEVIKQYDTIIALTDLSATERWFDDSGMPALDDPAANKLLRERFDPAARRQQRAQVLAITAKADGLMTSLTAYSSSLVELAAKGETGRDSVNKALAGLKDIASVAGVGTAGLATATGETVIAVAGEIGDIVTRAQAQSSLDDAMSVVTAAHGAQKIASILNAYTSNESGLVEGLARQRNLLEKYKVGAQMVTFYNKNSTWRARETAFALLNAEDTVRSQALASRTEAQLYSGLKNCYTGKRGCPTTSAVSSLAGTQLLMRAVSQDAHSYYDTVSQVNAWQKQQQDKLAAIGAAVDVWAAEHDKLAAYFRECAGFRAAKANCGTYSAANLKAAVEQIQGILSSLKTDPPPAAAH